MSGVPRIKALSLDAVLMAGAVVLLAIITAVGLHPRVAVLTASPAIEVITFTALTLAASAAAVLAWIRSRGGREVGAVYETSAFLLAASLNGLLVLPALAWHQNGRGEPEATALVGMALVRAAAAVLLIVGAARALARQQILRRQVPILVVAPSILVWAAVIGTAVLGWFVVDAEAVEHLILGTGGARLPQLAIQSSVAVAFLVGTFLYRRLFRRTGKPFYAYMSLALLVAAGSQAQFAFAPDVVTRNVTIDEVLRVLFYGLVLMGSVQQLRGELHLLRPVVIDADRLRDADLIHATLMERHRVAREIHDGLAQDLAAARLRMHALRQTVGTDTHLSGLAGSTETALGRAIVGARDAIDALRGHSALVRNARDELTVQVEMFRRRFDIPASARIAKGDGLSAIAIDETILVAREALGAIGSAGFARSIDVTFLPGRNGTTLMIHADDDGLTWNVQTLAALRAALKLRARRIRAAVVIEAASGRGSTIRFRVPHTSERAGSKARIARLQCQPQRNATRVRAPARGPLSHPR